MASIQDIVRKIQQVLPSEDWKTIEGELSKIIQSQGRRAQKVLIMEINTLISDTAFKNNKPDLLFALPDLPGFNIDDLFHRIIQQFIVTKDEKWLKSVFSLSDKLGKKSYQSRIFAMMARTLIEAGVAEAHAEFIDTGMIMLEQISFRKYRSDVMIDIIPLLIEWSIISRNEKLLRRSHHIIEEISDISKRAVLHAELANAMATIAILEKNRLLFLESIRDATKIHQKIRRQSCILSIIEKGVKSTFGKEILDVPLFIQNFKDLPEESRLEIVSALTEQILERLKDKNEIIAILQILCERMPFVTSTLVVDLLKKAETSGDLWFLSAAITIHQLFLDHEVYPIRELVRAGVSVAKHSNSMPVLSDLIPIIDKNSDPVFLSRIYLQFSQIMLSSGDFISALNIFRKISHETETLPQYADNLTDLLKTGVLKDNVPLIKEMIYSRVNPDVLHHSVYRAVVELSTDNPFEDIISHAESINELVLLHPQQNYLLLESIAILVDRGFLALHNPDVLIAMAESIQDQPLKEQAIANIVIQIAKIGVQIKNRDYLQRAVGLTCQIDGQDTRSATLSSIIDEASNLAARQGDLDLLLRMRAWSSSLLEERLAGNAMANIIEGVIQYAISRRSPMVLEEAFGIAQDITDPVLKTQQFEKIAECFVKIGCMLLNEPSSRTDAEAFIAEIYPFERALSILKENIKTPWISLKIAGMIDILISYSRTADNPDYSIPLAMFSVEIENPFERDAMMSRIISNLKENVTYPDSTDPYEIMAYLLQRNRYATSNPLMIGLIFRFLQLISNLYVRLSGLCSLAESSIKLSDLDHALTILDDVCQALPKIPAEYQKVIILSDLAILFCSIDPDRAKKCLEQAIQGLEFIEPEENSGTRKRIISAIVRLNEICPDDGLINRSLEVASKITDPVEYIDSLTAIFTMVRSDQDRRSGILAYMTEAAERIHSPYEKASALLDIISLSMQNTGDKTPVILLKRAEALTKKINIPQIADTIRDNIARMFVALSHAHNNAAFLQSAIDVAKTIDSIEIRHRRLAQMGYKELHETPTPHEKIRLLFEKIIETGAHPNQVASLEKMVRSLSDRGKEAIIFCDLAVLSRKAGEEKIAGRMLQNAIREARIIRPLSHRAFVMCDIAMKTHASGNEKASQEVLDLAIDAATNIRQSSLRDEVFEELGLAIKLMQGMYR
jgi:tetratricopeptide (TPR) repeat protein